ncbi:MAG: hypothetical protein NC397_08980 [Clostridium sp.]|nr:hypothetical protein [Clostridium sp.]
MDKQNWAVPELRKYPWWRDNMTPEEYDEERDYYYENFESLVKKGLYKPLWQQKNN